MRGHVGSSVALREIQGDVGMRARVTMTANKRKGDVVAMIVTSTMPDRLARPRPGLR